jgi:hypothetical protein
MHGMDELFEERYQQWKSFINADTLSLSSSSDDYFQVQILHYLLTLMRMMVATIKINYTG